MYHLEVKIGIPGFILPKVLANGGSRHHQAKKKGEEVDACAFHSGRFYLSSSSLKLNLKL
jgi:hypothetical protein